MTRCIISNLVKIVSVVSEIQICHISYLPDHQEVYQHLCNSAFTEPIFIKFGILVPLCFDNKIFLKVWLQSIKYIQRWCSKMVKELQGMSFVNEHFSGRPNLVKISLVVFEIWICHMSCRPDLLRELHEYFKSVLNSCNL